MTLRSFALPLVALSLFAGCAAESTDDGTDSSTQDIVSVTSAYTESSRATPLDGCRVTREGRYDCGEMGGYTLVASHDGFGQGVLVRAAAGTFALHHEELGAGYFGKLAEWRGRGISSGRVEPNALIMRYFTPTAGYPYGSFGGKNVLVVAKLSPEGVCVHSTVSGATPNHNQIARDIADSLAFRDFQCAPQTPEPNAPTGCGVLQPNTGLARDESVSSCSGSHSLVMQSDGNLVLYNNRNGRATWSSQTAGSPGEAAIMGTRGQLGVFANERLPLFFTPTAENDGASLAVQDDGNVVIYTTNGRAIWATNTQGR